MHGKSDSHSTRSMPEIFRASSLRQLVPFPRLHERGDVSRMNRISRLRGVHGLGKKEEHGFFLLDAREVEEIRVGMQEERAVRIGRQDVVVIHRHERTLGCSSAQSRRRFSMKSFVWIGS